METEHQENKLVIQAQGGCRMGFDKLAENYYDRLVFLIASRLGPRLRARLSVEDLVQETMVQAFKSIDRFEWKGEGSFFAWLSTVAEHVIQNAARTDRRHPELELNRDVSHKGQTQSKAARRHARFDRLQGAMNSLSRDHREVIYLARIEGLRMKDVATRMNRSVDAVKHLLSRALGKLRVEFGDTESFTLPHNNLVLKDRTHDEDTGE